jgi:predicted MFS family arabinose efflux permease
MRGEDRRPWFIVAVLFVALVLCYGTILNTVGMFVAPLVKEFHWSRTQASVLTSVIALLSGVTSLLAGWLLDRIEAKFVMVAGVTAAVAGYLLAASANSFSVLVCAHVLLGIGMGAAGLVPASMVIANWFEARRGAALAVAISGTSFGGLIGNIFTSRIIASRGWRAGYVSLSIPMAVIAAPLILFAVQTRPSASKDETAKLNVREASDRLPGFEVAEALLSRSFWMLVAATFCFWAAVNPVETHLIPYLIGIGYQPTVAATVFSIIFPSVMTGKVVMGLWADRITARWALVVDFIMTASTFWGLLYIAPIKALIVPLILLSGFPGGVPLALTPMVQSETMGLKRFGSIGGLVGFAGTLGATVGPIAVGALFDALGSYNVGFEACSLLLLIGAMALYGTVPMEYQKTAHDVKPLQVREATLH